MRDAARIIDDLGGTTSFARGVGIQQSAASEMKRRGSIPVKYWPAVISLSESMGKPITSDDLMAAHAGEHTA